LEIIVNSWGALDLESRAFLVKRIGTAMFCWIWSLERGSFKDPIIILMDSGGGSYMHISVATALLCDRYNAHPFVLPAYCTKALMPLDMTPHAVMSKKWAEFKRAWARQDSTLSIWSALAALRRIVDEGLSAVNARAGWSHVGLQPGSGFLRDKVLVDRFDEILRQKGLVVAIFKNPNPKPRVLWIS
jgi:hypothetical protein